MTGTNLQNVNQISDSFKEEVENFERFKCGSKIDSKDLNTDLSAYEIE